MTGRRSRSKGAPLSGKGRRRKGLKGEWETRDAFRQAMPGADIERGIGQARSNSEVADVDAPAFWIETKRQKQANVRAALQQAHEACKDPDRWPVAVIRDDRKPAFVAMGLEDFLELVAAWWARGGRGRPSRSGSQHFLMNDMRDEYERRMAAGFRMVTSGDQEKPKACGDEYHYQGEVLCRCDRPTGHDGTHSGRNLKHGFRGDWSRTEQKAAEHCHGSKE